MASTSKHPEDGDGTTSSPANPAAETAPSKRHKSVRTAIRQLLKRSTSEAIGRFGDTEDGSNKRAVGSTSMELETKLTGDRAGHRGKKHVKVEVIMSVSDDGNCVCPPVTFPPVPPVTPPKKARVYYWWLVAPILGSTIMMVQPNETHKQQRQPPAVTVSVPAPTNTTISAPAKGPIPTPVAVPVEGSGKPSQPPAATSANPDGVNGTQSGTVTPTGAPTGPVSTLPESPITQPPYVGGACYGLTGQLATAPDYTQAHTPAWVKSHTDSWFVKRLPRCGATVQAFDVCSRVLNVQDYGDGMVYLGQRVFSREGNRVQIDRYNAQDQFVGRTTYIYAGTGTGRVALAYEFDSREHRLLEARVDRNNDGSIRNIVIWTFGNAEQVLSQTNYSTTEQIDAILKQHFNQFPE